jgi:hypothetical protein
MCESCKSIHKGVDGDRALDCAIVKRVGVDSCGEVDGCWKRGEAQFH